jgi:hypothetical protein
MIIKLDERYFIEDEKYGYILVDKESLQTKNDKKSDKDFDTYRQVWYFADLHKALKRYCKLVLSESGAVISLGEYIKRYEDLMAHVESLI